MDIEQIIIPTGILAFALFAFSMLNGIERFRLLRYHSVSGYLCCLVAVIHSIAAMLSHIFEPLGMLAVIGMILTTLGGYFKWGKRSHIVLAVLTLIFSILHVAFIWYMRS